MLYSNLEMVIMKHILLIPVIVLMIVLSCKDRPSEKHADEMLEMALDICERNILLDSHIDWPEWVHSFPEDISRETRTGDFDLVRAEKGGLNAALSVVYIPPRLGIEEGRIRVDSLMDLVRDHAKVHPDKFGLAAEPEDIRKNFHNGLFSLPLCLENGTPIGDDLGYLKYLKEQGIVYITLNHSKTNQISDSSYDTNRVWRGLSPFGIEVINEMNRLGLMIDISHSTDSTVFQSLRYSKAPIVATHSSCRYFTPGYERNLSDTLIKAIAEKNGIVMVNFGSQFLDSVCQKNWNYLIQWYDSTGIDEFSEAGVDFTLKYGETHSLFSNSARLVDHIDHIVRIAGIDHVGLGSDYDGIGYSQPSDLQDVSSYPVIVAELLRRGYEEKDIRKILSENFLRVWDEVLETAGSINADPSD